MRIVILLLLILFPYAPLSQAQVLEEYLGAYDPAFTWETINSDTEDGFQIERISLTSQVWRDITWKHDLVIVRPPQISDPSTIFLHIGGSTDGSRFIPSLKLLSERAGIVAAGLADVPNQPLFDGKTEDRLLAYTLRRYTDTGDKAWPIIFPMVKSAVRAMDVLTRELHNDAKRTQTHFIVSGASKRGWTTWLTGAVDKRIIAIAPKVFDMLNMKAQTDWAAEVYGKQSEKIKDYTDLGLIEEIDTPRVKELRKWIDPYSYLDRLTMPKLILLGSNDPYWVVDALSHYWNDLKGPKAVYQSPNTGHHLGLDSEETLATWIELLVRKEPVPEFGWRFNAGPPADVTLRFSPTITSLREWHSCAAERDFRNAIWGDRLIPLAEGATGMQISLERTGDGLPYCASIIEARFKTAAGSELRLSTEAFVTTSGGS